MRIVLGRCKVGTGGELEVPMHAACAKEWWFWVPTWPMVKAYKAGTLDIPGYLEQYKSRLRRSGKSTAENVPLGFRAPVVFREPVDFRESPHRVTVIHFDVTGCGCLADGRLVARTQDFPPLLPVNRNP